MLLVVEQDVLDGESSRMDVEERHVFDCIGLLEHQLAEGTLWIEVHEQGALSKFTESMAHVEGTGRLPGTSL